MDSISLEIIKWNYKNSNDLFYIEDYITTLKYSNSFSQIAGELNFTMPYATMSDNLLPLNIEMGDVVKLFYMERLIFAGKVTDTDIKGKNEELSVTCYDYLWYLCKGNITKNFDNISVRSALTYVYEFINAMSYDIEELGSNGDIILKSHLVQGKPASKTLYAIYSEVTKKTNKYYYMHMEDDASTIIITEADKYFSGLTIQPPTNSESDNLDGSLIDYQITKSMQNMITQVKFYDSTGAEAKNIEDLSLDTESINKYGRIIENIKVSSEDTTGQLALKEGKKKLKDQGKPSEELTVTCFGNIDYRVAHGVVVKIPNTEYYDKCMYIVSSEWTWNNDGTFISKLTLSSSKNTNKYDWDSIEDKQEQQEDANSTSTTNGTSSDLVNRIITELKSHIGEAYKYGGKSPADGGMDCSGYISYCYNQFSSELEIKSNDGQLTSVTYAMIEQGKDVTNDFPSNLKQCDIVFPGAEQGGHVVAYIGDGQIIEEPGTGKTCRVVTMSEDSRFNSAYKVIRVVPDSAWATTKTTTDSNAPDLNSAAECTSQTDFAGIVAAYAKELFSTYHIFPGVIIANMIQESWAGDGFTKLAKSDYNFGGVKIASSSEEAATDYLPPSNEGSTPYRKFNSVSDYMENWCIFMTTSTSASTYGYKTEIADKSTPTEQMQGFANVPYCGDPAGKAKALISIYKSDNLSQYDEGLY